MLTDTACSYGALMLSVVFRKGAWQWHLNKRLCVYAASVQLVAKQTLNAVFTFCLFFFVKAKKTSSDFFALVKPGTNVGIS